MALTHRWRSGSGSPAGRCLGASGFAGFALCCATTSCYLVAQRQRQSRQFERGRGRRSGVVRVHALFLRRNSSGWREGEEDLLLKVCYEVYCAPAGTPVWISIDAVHCSNFLPRAARKVANLLLARPSSSYQNVVGRRGMAELSNTAAVLQRSTGTKTSPTAAACTTASQTAAAPSTSPTPTAPTPSPKGARANKTRGGRGRVPFDERAVTEGGFFVAGAWSKAGVCSCFNIRHRHLLGKHGVVFDMGVCPAEVCMYVVYTHSLYIAPYRICEASPDIKTRRDSRCQNDGRYYSISDYGVASWGHPMLF